MRFGWNEAKRQTNIKIHGIDFTDAVRIFDGPTREALDTRADYGEDRWDEDDVEVYRIISAREATSHERRHYEERD